MDIKTKPIISIVALKFSFLVCFIILITMVVMAGLVLQNARESLVKKLELDSVNYARECREAFLPRPNTFLLHFSTLKTAKLQGVDYALVMDENGVVLSHSKPMFIGEKKYIGHIAATGYPQKIYNEQIKKSGGVFREISVPIIIKDMMVGVVSIGLSEKSINLALKDTYKKIVLITITVLAGAFLITILIVSIMVQPVNELARAAYHVGQGNLNYSLNIKQKDEFGYLAYRFNDMIAGLKERDFIHDTFGKYVTKEVARAVLSSKMQLGGERRSVSILVTDLRGFTKMSEKMQPEEVVVILNRYFKVMVDIIIKYKGTLDKYIGDSILAVFGAPLALEDHARRAVMTGLDMMEALKALNSELVFEGKMPLDMGIGVNSGVALVGNIGSEVRMEYTAIGDVVNAAARIESLNKDWNTKFLISKNTYDYVSDLVEIEDRGQVLLKGKQENIHIYNVLGPLKTSKVAAIVG